MKRLALAYFLLVPVAHAYLGDALVAVSNSLIALLVDVPTCVDMTLAPFDGGLSCNSCTIRVLRDDAFRYHVKIKIEADCETMNDKWPVLISSESQPIWFFATFGETMRIFDPFWTTLSINLGTAGSFGIDYETKLLSDTPVATLLGAFGSLRGADGSSNRCSLNDSIVICGDNLLCFDVMRISPAKCPESNDALLSQLAL